MAKRIVLAGDSFGCEWPTGEGWPLMLAKNHAVNNIAQAGVGEYKILKHLRMKMLIKKEVLKKLLVAQFLETL